MPMIWNPENEAKFLAAIFKICDVKPSSTQLAAVAKIMGPDCTAKALTHRMTKIRNAGKDIETVNGGGDAGDEEGETPKPKRAKKAAGEGTKKKSTPAKKKAAGSEDDFEGADGAGPTPPPSDDKKAKAGSKRARNGTIKREPYDEADGIAVGEDIGEGLRATPPEYQSGGEEGEFV